MNKIILVITIAVNIACNIVCFIIAFSILSIGSITFMEPNLFILGIEILLLIFSSIGNIYLFIKSVKQDGRSE